PSDLYTLSLHDALPISLEARVQPQLEGLVLITLAIILVLNLVPQGWARRASGGLLLAIALLTLVRLLRWQIWHCLDRPDLLALRSEEHTSELQSRENLV